MKTTDIKEAKKDKAMPDSNTTSFEAFFLVVLFQIIEVVVYKVLTTKRGTNYQDIVAIRIMFHK